MFLQRLFEIEIPEIYDGIIELKAIAREPGERAKVAVESQDKRIDAVGACVGMKGVRIHAIVRELNNENIDVINFTEDPLIFIQRALAPAKLKKIDIDTHAKKAVVTADSDQVSLIVGRNGVNIRLAMKLTGYEIEILREEKPFEEYEEDIELIDIKEELGNDVYELLINHRYDTAIEVLTAGPEKLKEIEGLDDEKIAFIIETIKSQFEEEE
jgi:N utilization substance protein A